MKLLLNTALEVMREAEPDRTKYLGGSDAAAIMGVGAYERTPLVCYLAKTGQLVGEPMSADKQKFLARRKRWEGPIFEMLKEEFGAKIVAENQRYIDPEFDYMAAEIDFEWVAANGSTQNGEVKTVSPFAYGEKSGWGEAGTSDIPVHYAAQVMWGLMVTGRRACIVGAMIGLDSFVFYNIERDEETIAAMRATAVTFWTDHVLKRVPPDPISLSDVMNLTARMTGKPVALDAPTLEALRKIQAIRETRKAMEFETEELEYTVFDFVRRQWDSPATDLAELPPENALLTFEGNKVGSWTRQRGAHLDQKRLKSAHPELVAEFTKQSFHRVLRLSK